jgi:hypothetical protein
MKRLLTAVAIVASGCFTPVYVAQPFTPAPPPAPEDVAAVVFLVGDAGDTPMERSPLVHRLREDVEEWSASLRTDSAVSVLFLGDNVYPVGMRDRSHDGFEPDSARLYAQVFAVSGPEARQYRTLGVFIPGNHDWGNTHGANGARRLLNQEEALDAHRAAGAPVRMLPTSGLAGPAVLDLPGQLRVLSFDTEWWLQSDEHNAQEQALNDIERAIAGADGRTILFAAHHPFMTAGPHSGLTTAFDPIWVLRRAGVNVQDVNSGPYKALLNGLSSVFERTEAPLIYAAGHDHSLQLLAGAGPSDPRWTLVSGGASKSTPVAATDELEWASVEPGYMRVVILKDGGVMLYAESAPAQYLSCTNPDPAPCIEAGAAAFGTSYSRRLR